jgi:8-oxo-dGTP diphosphatase
MTQNDGEFHGAKLLLFLGAQLLVIRRDRKPHIPWPGYLDFPGGGREGAETAVSCVLRETREEVGLNLRPADLTWRHELLQHDRRSWFFAAHIEESEQAVIRLGDEGSGWMLMAPKAYLERADAIPHFRDVLRLYLRVG